MEHQPIKISNPLNPQSIDINGDRLEIIPLGSGSEVGRSCIIIKFQSKTPSILRNKLSSLF